MIGALSSFSAAVVEPSGEQPAQIGYWCGWCETVHAHGLAGMTTAEAIGETEARGAHCLPRRSPLAGHGVELSIDRVVRSWDHIEPPGPYLAVAGDPLKTRVRLGAVLEGGRLGLALLRLIFGKNRAASGFDARLVGGWAQVWGGGSSWFVQNDERDTLAEGQGIGTLLARLFGVPLGVVAVRVLEDAVGLGLSADYTRIIAALVDRAAVGEPPPVIADELVLSFGRHGTLDLGGVMNDVAEVGGRKEEEGRP